MDINEIALGRVVCEIRLSSKMTQRELCEKTGLSINYISLLENGRRGISIPNLNLVANALGIPAALITTLAANAPEESNSLSSRLFTQIQETTRQAVDLYLQSS